MSVAITQYIDVAQIVLYLFFAFFAGLVYYLHRENKREGYPLENERSPYVKVQGFPSVPRPKTFLIVDGSVVHSPRAETYDGRPFAAVPAASFPGAPLVPTGNAMLSNAGPASYAERADIPDVTVHGTPKIVPMRSVDTFHIDSRDPNPLGMTVVGADGRAGGVVRDIWVDRAESLIRYYEVEVGDKAKKRNVLLPATLARVSGEARQIRVKAVLGAHFAEVPAHRKPDSVTRLEEEKITAYYASGHLYATASRAEPLI
jgi:photosynthetic reaction center H subunit